MQNLQNFYELIATSENEFVAMEKAGKIIDKEIASITETLEGGYLPNYNGLIERVKEAQKNLRRLNNASSIKDRKNKEQVVIWLKTINGLLSRAVEQKKSVSGKSQKQKYVRRRKPAVPAYDTRY